MYIDIESLENSMKGNLTTVFLCNPAKFIPPEVAEHFLNKDGSEPLGSVFFPKTPVVLPNADPHISMVVNATFTTPQEFVVNPPPQFVLTGGKKLTVENLLSTLEWNVWATYNLPERFAYTLFDGVLVWGWVWNWG